MNYSLVITTCASSREADKLAALILKKKLAACIQISSIQSYYTWKDEVKNEPEYKLLIKTRKNLYRKLEAFIHQNHSYEVPEIVEIHIQSGLKEYLDWIEEETEN